MYRVVVRSDLCHQEFSSASTKCLTLTMSFHGASTVKVAVAQITSTANKMQNFQVIKCRWIPHLSNIANGPITGNMLNHYYCCSSSHHRSIWIISIPLSTNLSSRYPMCIVKVKAKQNELLKLVMTISTSIATSSYWAVEYHSCSLLARYISCCCCLVFVFARKDMQRAGERSCRFWSDVPRPPRVLQLCWGTFSSMFLEL